MTHKPNCSLLNQYGRGGNPCDCGATERDWGKEFDKNRPKYDKKLYSSYGVGETFLFGYKYRESGSIHEVTDWGNIKKFIQAVESAAEKRGREKERKEYKDALIWCSGSEDFQLEGKAREGWEKICLPLIHKK